MSAKLERIAAICSATMTLALACIYFFLHSSPHRGDIRVALFVFSVLNFGLLYSHNKKKPQPDSLTHLFPASPSNLKELPTK